MWNFLINLTMVACLVISAPVLSQAVQKPIDFQSSTTYTPTDPSQTLWRIATKYNENKPFSVHQTMLAIYQLNPTAFKNGDINAMQSGVPLNLPSDRYVRGINADTAKSKVLNGPAKKSSATNNPVADVRPTTNNLANTQPVNVKPVTTAQQPSSQGQSATVKPIQRAVQNLPATEAPIQNERQPDNTTQGQLSSAGDDINSRPSNPLLLQYIKNAHEEIKEVKSLIGAESRDQMNMLISLQREIEVLKNTPSEPAPQPEAALVTPVSVTSIALNLLALGAIAYLIFMHKKNSAPATNVLANNVLTSIKKDSMGSGLSNANIFSKSHADNVRSTSLETDTAEPRPSFKTNTEEQQLSPKSNADKEENDAFRSDMQTMVNASKAHDIAPNKPTLGENSATLTNVFEQDFKDDELTLDLKDDELESDDDARADINAKSGTEATSHTDIQSNLETASDIDAQSNLETASDIDAQSDLKTTSETDTQSNMESQPDSFEAHSPLQQSNLPTAAEMEDKPRFKVSRPSDYLNRIKNAEANNEEERPLDLNKQPSINDAYPSSFEKDTNSTESDAFSSQYQRDDTIKAVSDSLRTEANQITTGEQSKSNASDEEDSDTFSPFTRPF